MTVVGRVVGLWRHPVKSMAGESLEEAEVGWYGLAGDRRFAFIRGGVAHGFPWLTIRQRADLVRFIPRFDDPSDPDRSTVTVRTPDGRDLAVDDPALADELGHDCRLLKLDRGAFDAHPLSLITTQTVAALVESVGDTLDPRRFRPNLLVEASEARPFQEDDWVGEILRVGGARMQVARRDRRCVVMDVDPETGQRGKGVLRAVQSDREGQLGVYGSVVRTGRVAVGDDVVRAGSEA